MNDKKLIYFDNNATTPLHVEVKKEIQNALDHYGNPSSMYELGREAKRLVQKSREKLASFMGAESEEIIFTSGGTESNNTALSLVLNHKDFLGKEVITTKIEHPSIIESVKFLKSKNIKIHLLDVDKYGKIKIDHLESLLSEKIGLVSVGLANNEVGTIQDIKTISNLAHKHGALVHTDAVQALGKIPLDVRELNIDMLSLSAHKIYGPKGIGALYIKNKTAFSQFMYGGHQEKGRRAGTENILGIVGLGKAIDMRSKEMKKEKEHLQNLKSILKQGIQDTIPDVIINGHPTDSVANTLNVSFMGAEGESILLYLDLERIMVSTGSACAAASLEPSHVLLAMGLPVEYAHGSIRISMGHSTSQEDVERFLDVLPKIIKKIRNISVIYKNKR